MRRDGERFDFVTDIPKDDCARFGILPATVPERELALGRKLAAHKRLGDFTSNRRGAGLQKHIQASSTRGRRIVGGRQIQPWLIADTPAFIPRDSTFPDHARVHAGSILAQNILTFSIKPVDHVRITATLAPNNADFVILDTVNQLRLKADCPYSSIFLLALLNSLLIRWYSFRFIHAGATMTLHFDTPASAPLPVPAIDFSDPVDVARHDAIVALATRMITLHVELARFSKQQDDRRHDLQRRIETLDAQIDAQVYALFGLDDAEIALVEGRAD